MADNRHISEEYAKIGAELVRTEPVLQDIRDSDAIIVYLASDLEKNDGEGRIVYGECERIKDKYKWGLPADFTITLFEPNLQGKSREAIRRIIFHELLHVGIGVGKEEMEQYYVRKHDIEDFKYLIDRYGTDWASVGDEPVCEVNVEEMRVRLCDDCTAPCVMYHQGMLGCRGGGA